MGQRYLYASHHPTPHFEQAILKADCPSLAKCSDDCNPRWNLDYNLMRNPKLEPPNPKLEPPKFLFIQLDRNSWIPKL